MRGARELPWLVAVFACLAVGAWLVADADRAPAAPDVPEGVEPVDDARAEAPAPGRDGRLVDVAPLGDEPDGFDVAPLVVDARGAPLAGARVAVYRQRVDDALDERLAVKLPLAPALVPDRTARTGPDGRAAFDAVPGGARVVASTDDGRASRALRAIELVGDDPPVLVVAELPALDVEVLAADGRPAPGAVVRVDLSDVPVDVDGEPWAHGPRVTDADGRARLAVPRGVVAVSALVDAAPTEAVRFAHEAARGVMLHAPGARRLVVRVEGADDGAPLADARVALARVPGAAVPDDVLGVTYQAASATGADGRAAFALPVGGRWRLAATAPGRSARRDHEVVLAGDATRRDVVLRLERPTLLAGRVVDERGRPVDVGRVVARRVTGADELVELDLPNRVADVTPDGRFVVEGVERTGRHELWYEPPAAGFDRSAPTGRGVLADVEPGARDLVLVVRDDDGGFVHPFNRRVAELPDDGPRGDAAVALVVRDADGEVVPRVLVARERRAASGWRAEGGRRLSRAGDDGRHRVDELVDGDAYRFTLHADGHGVARSDAVTAARPAPRVDVVLPRAARLAVAVTVDGRAAPFAEVDLARPADERAWPTRRTDTDGRAVFDDLLAGAYELVVRHAGRSAIARVDLAPGDDVALDLPLDAD